MMNGQVLNKESLARESHVKRPTIDHYFGILEDTLIGSYIEAFSPGYKSKEVRHPKFYIFDTGVVRACAGLLDQDLESEFLGFMFETFILAQMKAFINYSQKSYPIYHYSITHSYDIDFLVETKKPVMGKRGSVVCIEVKLGKKLKSEWLQGMIDFRSLSKYKVDGSHLVYTGSDLIETDGIKVWPVEMFLEKLFSGELL